MQLGAYSVASLIPVQLFAGCAALQRFSPMGGKAKGIPLNAVTDASESTITPFILPSVRLTIDSSEKQDRENENRISPRHNPLLCIISLQIIFNVICRYLINASVRR